MRPCFPPRQLAAFWLVGAILAVPAGARAEDRSQSACREGPSSGTPRVETRHIFCGEINRRGLAVGFHSRPRGRNPPTVSGTGAPRSVAGHPGLYNLIRFQISEGGQTGTKGISTMYPDKCSAADVVAAIQHAYNNGQHNEERFTGPSGPSCTDADGRPFPIAGFTGRRGGLHIRTGYPDVGGGRQ